MNGFKKFVELVGLVCRCVGTMRMQNYSHFLNIFILDLEYALKIHIFY